MRDECEEGFELRTQFLWQAQMLKNINAAITT